MTAKLSPTKKAQLIQQAEERIRYYTMMVNTSIYPYERRGYSHCRQAWKRTLKSLKAQ